MADKRPMTIRLDPDLHEKIRRSAFVTRKSMQAIIVEALELWLDREEAGDGDGD